MIRVLVLVLPILLSLQPGWGQTTFNVVRHNANMLGAQGRSVFELEDGYLLFSVEWGSDSSTTSLFVSKFDVAGDFLWSKEHNVGRDLDPGVIDPIAQQDSVFIASVTGFGGQDPKVSWFYWFNAEGDTIRTRLFKSDSNVVQGSHGTRQLVALSDGGLLHCGWCANTVPAQGCITKTNNFGEILWEQTYPVTEYVVNAKEAPDGGFVLGGVRNAAQDEAVVIRTDSMGNQLWVQYHGLYSVTGGKEALLDNEGNILMAGSWNPDPNWWAYDRWSSLYKYSPDGIPLDRKDYFFSYNAEATFVLDKPDGYYWLVGGMLQYSVDPDGVTTIWELDENLDSLWMRQYWHYAPDDAQSFIYCVRSTSDGGLVMCGSTRQGVTDPLPYLTSNWLIKLDEHGCLVPGCHTVGMQEHVLGLDQYLRAWPNPVTSGQAITIAFEPPKSFVPNGPLRVIVQDALGRQVHEEMIAAPTSSFTMRTGLPDGLYYIHLTDGSRWLAGRKVVVQ